MGERSKNEIQTKDQKSAGHGPTTLASSGTSVVFEASGDASPACRPQGPQRPRPGPHTVRVARSVPRRWDLSDGASGITFANPELPMTHFTPPGRKNMS